MKRAIWEEKEGDCWVAAWGASHVRTYRPAPGQVVVWRCAVADEDDLSGVVRDLLALAPTPEGRIVTWETPDRLRINRELLDAGCTVHRSKLFVQRELVGEDLPPTLDFAWRTLAQVGDDELARHLTEASEGDPFEDEPRDPRREWDDLVEATGNDLDPALWRVAWWEGEPVGVVLPTVWEGKRREGTLSYVGVLPAHRGRGLGRALHAAGLRLLAEAGALRYAGSTDVRNLPMARVFERNGCPTTSVQLILRAPVDGSGDRR